MKLYCLSSSPAKPCLVVSLQGARLMLDCALCAAPVLSFVPRAPTPGSRMAALPAYCPASLGAPELAGELRESCGRVFVDSAPEFCPPLERVVDFARLDAVLLSNYTCMLALPFVTEDTGFRGQVLATEPTLQIGRLYLEELCTWLSGDGGGGGGARRWKELVHLLPAPLNSASKPRGWRRLYSRATLERALARVRVVAYDEACTVAGVKTTAVSSGYCLGSCNWVVQAGGRRLAYVGGSSTLTTHPRPVNQAALRGAELLVLAALTQTPAHNPDNMLGDLCMSAAATLRAGGCVLLPVHVSGVVYDLLECLSAHLEGAGLGSVPLYLVSPAAQRSLAYSNILAEWLSHSKQARVYLPEEPFVHAQLLRSARLRHYSSVHDDSFSADFRQPCVVFCGHPSLRFGDAVHFIEMWGSNPLHAVIFTEPDYPHVEALAPFQPLAMKAYHCPIDTSLNYAQANKLVRELRPAALAAPEQYVARNGGPGLVAPDDRPVLTLRRGGVLRVAAPRAARRASLSAELAAALGPRELRPGLLAAPLSAELVARDDRLELRPAPLHPGGWRWAGAPDSDRLLRELAREGVTETRLERGPDGEGRARVLHLPAYDTLLQLERHTTHVFCGPDPRHRAALRRALAACTPP